MCYDASYDARCCRRRRDRGRARARRTLYTSMHTVRTHACIKR